MPKDIPCSRLHYTHRTSERLARVLFQCQVEKEDSPVAACLLLPHIPVGTKGMLFSEGKASGPSTVRDENAAGGNVAARFLTTFNPGWLVVLSHTPRGWLLME